MGARGTTVVAIRRRSRGGYMRLRQLFERVMKGGRRSRRHRVQRRGVLFTSGLTQGNVSRGTVRGRGRMRRRESRVDIVRESILRRRSPLPLDHLVAIAGQVLWASPTNSVIAYLGGPWLSVSASLALPVGETLKRAPPGPSMVALSPKLVATSKTV